MNGNKQQDHNFNPSSAQLWAKTNLPNTQSSKRHPLVQLAGRAVVTYLVLFFTIALVLSVFGVNPLVREAFMPRALLVFVGLATIIAAANIITNHSQEDTFSWRNVAQHVKWRIIR
jgi:hypothetical protein